MTMTPEQELAKLRKAFALFILELLDSEGHSPDIPDTEVEKLARYYSDNPLGECDVCGKRAPLKTQYLEPEWFKRVCAWGCEP